MKTDRNDYFNKIFVGVLILHIIFLYIMPGLKKIVIKEPEVSKITIGINNYSVDSAPKKIIEKKKAAEVIEQKEVKVAEKKEELKKEIPEKIEKKVEKKKILQMTQSFDDLDILASLDSPREVSKSGEDLKPKIIKVSDMEDKNKITEMEDRKLNEINDNPEDRIEENLDSVEAVISDNGSEKIVVKNDPTDGVKDIRWDNLMSEENPNIVGPKSGLKVGSVDGKSKVIWDPSNKDPKYPLEAEKNAQTADVKIILDVDADGKVLRVRLVKTGVDVIDRAVESIARDWNIKLINSGMAVSGSVMVEYKFKLKGR
ncbi:MULTISPECIES: TonB family protein [Psychrilyobacter]|uniref:TonB family protein n=1 Tax=Psychrilyobacter piezotolerans TaxID=2293438 RepID=A0ABX9KKN9_9FUSO|nr:MULTISPECIES: TonB family protein [Psychrilyobacter]MCS5421430.1 TonB family protein [Psychrilyobacter sp. S5]NDI76588.1 TonB family protein [Psychrilyobacter piezotolerans]RDE65220.1 TonB family protein [Psychrilyobacter sp. S5]REI42838.1 TonB family protein [Psychrilyobacter piezotolerans]